MDRRGSRAEAADLFNSSQYAGDIKSDRYHGFGSVTFAQNNEYCGNFVDGRIHGLGTMLWDDGLKYVGDWDHNVASGNGCLSWPNGVEYYGEVQRGRRHGSGVQTQGEVRYCGEWKRGVRDGVGVLTSPSSEYIGEWKDGKRNGWGVCRFRDGNRYEGTWEADKMKGFGRMVWVTTSKWGGQSEVISSKPSMLKEAVNKARANVSNVGAVSPGPLGPFTPATLSSQNVSESYTGEWLNNAPHGMGEYNFQFHNATTARELLFDTTNCYRGEFRSGQRHGFGTQYYADGTIYEGEWAENMKHGNGCIIHPEGQRDEVRMVRDAPATNRTRRPPTDGETAVADVVLDDIADAMGVKAVNEVINRYRNVLRHLYTVYSTVHSPVDFDAALDRIVDSQTGVIEPEFSKRPAMQAVKIPRGYTAMQRNSILTNEMTKLVVAAADNAAKSALANVDNATLEYNENKDIHVTETTLPTQEEIAHLPVITDQHRLLLSQTSNDGMMGSPASVNLTSPSAASVASPTFAIRAQLGSGRSLLTPGSPGRRGRSATPLEGILRSVTEAAMELPPPPLRRNVHAIMTRHQFHILLEDALLVDINAQAAVVERYIQPALQRRAQKQATVSGEDEASDPSVGDERNGRIQFEQFVEALVRLAYYKFQHTEPFFAVTALHGIDLSECVHWMMDNFLCPLSDALRELDHCDLMHELKVDPFIPDTTPDATLEDLRKQSIRNVRDAVRISQSRIMGLAGAFGASASTLNLKPDGRPDSRGSVGRQSVSAAATAFLEQTAAAATAGQSSRPGTAGTGAPPPAPPSHASNDDVSEETPRAAVGGDGLDSIIVPFVEMPETITASVIGKSSIEGTATIRDVKCELEFATVRVSVLPTAGRRTTKHHVVIVQRMNGHASFGGIIPQFQLDRIDGVRRGTGRSWLVERGLPALRPRHLLAYLPVVESLEPKLYELHQLYRRLSRDGEKAMMAKGTRPPPERYFDHSSGTKSPGAERHYDKLESGNTARLGQLFDVLLRQKIVVPDEIGVAERKAKEVRSRRASRASRRASQASTGTAEMKEAAADKEEGEKASGSNSGSDDEAPPAAETTMTQLENTNDVSGSQVVTTTSVVVDDHQPASTSTQPLPGSQPAVTLAFPPTPADVASAGSSMTLPPVFMHNPVHDPLPESIAYKEVGAVGRNVLFSAMQFLMGNQPLPCTAVNPEKALRPTELPGREATTEGLKTLYRHCPELHEAVLLRGEQERRRNQIKDVFRPLHIPVSMVEWQQATDDVELTFDQFLQCIVWTAVLLFQNPDDHTDVVTPVKAFMREIPALLEMPTSRQFLLPGTFDTVTSPPIQLGKPWAIKKKPPPKEDPRKRRKK